MTLPPVIRIFFAIDLPPITKQILGNFINTLKKRSKSRAIRWTKPDNLHITLQFLPEVNSEHVAHILKAVRNEVNGIFSHSTLKLGALHLFPHPYRPRVIVLDILPQEKLMELAKAIGRGITQNQYPIDERPYRAHLTLGRIKYPHGTKLNFLDECPLPALAEINLNEIILFRSEPQPEGSQYTVIERIPLSPRFEGTGDSRVPLP